MSKIAVQRIISKKFKLLKNTREIYKHSGLKIFPDDFDFKKQTLLLSNDILRSYSPILLFKKYNFILCDCETKFFDEKFKKSLKKMNDKILFFSNSFFEEIKDENLNSVFDFLKDKFNILINNQKSNIIKDEDNNSLNLNTKLPMKSKIELNTENDKKIFENLIILNSDNILDFIKSDLEIYDLIFCKKEDNKLIINENLKIEPEIKFKEYYNNLDLLHKNGKISKGTLMISPVNINLGEVLEKDKRTKITGININRGLHGDEVYIEDNQIVGIYKRKKLTLVGTLIEIKKYNKYCNIGLVKPIDSRLPEVKVFTIKNENFILRKVQVYILNWEVDSLNPIGIIYNILGNTGVMEDEKQAVLQHCSVEYANNWDDLLFRENINKNNFNLNAAYEELNISRVDLRGLEIYSIDPIGCTDIDDAIHFKNYLDYYEVGVHIADVGYYVKPGSFLDLEAKNRSTTIYLNDRRIDMLPSFLSSEMASLKENQDKVAISVVWKIDKNYKIFDTKIFKSLIKINKNMSYEEAENMIKKDPFKTLWDIANNFRHERFENGALDLNTCELYFNDLGVINRKTSLNCHFLVEEFMLKANISVAKFLIENNPEYSLLRKHPLPTAIELDSIDFTNSKTINYSLQKINPEKRLILKRVITRSMQQAIYFSSGETTDYYHFGLAIDLYTHFTSPIRRYPDLIVHRTLDYILQKDFDSVDRMNICVDKNACSKMNFRHRNAQLASRMVNDLCLANVLEKNNDNLDAVIISIKDDGVVVFNSEYGVEAFVETKQKYELFQNIKININNTFVEYCTNRAFNIKIVD